MSLDGADQEEERSLLTERPIILALFVCRIFLGILAGKLFQVYINIFGLLKASVIITANSPRNACSPGPNSGGMFARAATAASA